MDKNENGAVEDQLEEPQVEAKPCQVCEGRSIISCPMCAGREAGSIPPLEGEDVCDLCGGSGEVVCPICWDLMRKGGQKPTITVEFMDPLSAQFSIQIRGFHPALATGQISMVVDFLKTRTMWEQLRTFDSDEAQKAKKQQVSNLLRGVPMGGLSGGQPR